MEEPEGNRAASPLPDCQWHATVDTRQVPREVSRTWRGDAEASPTCGGRTGIKSGGQCRMYIRVPRLVYIRVRLGYPSNPGIILMLKIPLMTFADYYVIHIN